MQEVGLAVYVFAVGSAQQSRTIYKLIFIQYENGNVVCFASATGTMINF